ncbi:MAG: MobC family plasmid mobilization relaxosome protein [Clostridia bacterium]|nr:MobC family plasmid mobilization relaxosome protein [Clostridia bacterium]
MAESKRDVFFKVRLSAEENALLEEQSARTGRSKSDVLRAAWKRLKIVELPPADFAETLVQLRRIGNDLNRLTRAANEGDVKIPEIKETLSELTALDRRLSKILSGGGL